MHNKLNHRNFSHWIFDLDNTLYPEDDDIFGQVKEDNKIYLYKIRFKLI